jgi:asparagine synthase (glutamine-hydrolysing)
MARVLSCLELSDSTPYKGIHAVPPAHYLVFRKGVPTLRSHWNSVAETKIEYKSNAEYDEHFLSLFRQAVERRVVPGSLILAELSGGMDSSSIVCMADTVVRASSDSTELIDTISYYDPTEPDWDESPYFEGVEKHRGKSGIHLDCSTRVPSYEPLILLDRVYPYPGSDSTSLRIATELDSNIGRYRVILSGMGGDELLGGVPAPLPELADYLRGARFLTLISRATEWCLVSRQPVIYMLFNALVFTTNLYRPSRLSGDTVPPWLNSEMRQKCFSLNVHDAAKRPRYRDIPSAINGGRVWQTVLDALPHLVPPLVGCHEYRYPYLDRDLVDFLHRVPREQLVGPGRRRLLMRRALKGIVPIEVLERKRKACISRGPLFVLRNAHQKIEELFSDSFCADCGLIDRDKFLRAFRSGIRGDLKWIGQLTRTIGLELWLHSIKGSLSSFRAAPK